MQELDFNDSDFFSGNFIHCKAHGSLFDIRTGQNVRPPPKCRLLKPLQSVHAEIIGEFIYVDETKAACPGMPLDVVEDANLPEFSSEEELKRLEKDRARFMEQVRKKHPYLGKKRNK